MIWDGTSPLRPEHEVAYRGWPTERVAIIDTLGWETHPIKSGGSEKRHQRNGRYLDDTKEHRFDLIPLQEPQK